MICGTDGYAFLAGEPSPTNCIPHAAVATAALVGGFVVSATVTDGACGYTNTPVVRLIGGGGNQHKPWPW